MRGPTPVAGSAGRSTCIGWLHSAVPHDAMPTSHQRRLAAMAPVGTPLLQCQQDYSTPAHAGSGIRPRAATLRVDLRRCDRGMAQQRLDGTQIRTTLEHMHRK